MSPPCEETVLRILDDFCTGFAWLVAQGHETATSADGEAIHPYRMTMVAERRDEGWLLVHAHGSSPSD